MSFAWTVGPNQKAAARVTPLLTKHDKDMAADKHDKENKGYIVGIGEALWDVLPEGKKLGGAPANFAYHVSQFGLPGYAVSAVGPDELGHELLDSLDAKALSYDMARVPYPTGTVGVEIDVNGVPQYDIRRDVAWDHVPWTPALETLASQTRAVCFGSLAQREQGTRSTIHRFLDTVPDDEEHLKVFDINLRQDFYTRETVVDSMTRCNVLKINDEELVIISRMMEWPGIDLKDKCWILMERFNLRILILTCGVNGSYVFTPGHVSFVPTPKVKLADTVGAGDSFTATFVAGILRGLGVEQAHHLAVKVSAYVCTQAGPMPRLPRELTEQA